MARLSKGTLLKGAVTVALLTFLLWRVDFRAVIAALGRLSLSGWLIGLLLFLVGNLVAAAKWKLLLPRHHFAALLRLNFVGQYYALLLPGQIAGEAVKAYRLGKGKQDAEQIAASVMIDRITGFVGLLIVAVCGIAISSTGNRLPIVIALLCATVALIAILFSFHLPWWTTILDAVGKRGPRAARLAQQLRLLLAAWNSYVQAPLLMLASVALGAVFQLIAVSINYRFGHELGTHISIADWCWVFGFVSLATALPFTIGGVGLREGSFVGTLALLGVEAERALAVSFTVFTLLLVAAAIGAVLEWSWRSESIGKPAPIS